MKKRLFLADLVLLMILFTGAGIYAEKAWILALGAGVLGNTVLLFCLQRSAYERELARISGLMEDFLADKSIPAERITQDTLSSKIRHQLLRLQTMVQSFRERAEKDNREIRNLIVEIAHQLRMPLANMETYLGFLREEGLEARETARYLDAAEVSGRQLSFLIESFIKMARLETRIIQLKMEDGDLKQTVLDAILQEEKAAREKRIHIRLFAEKPARALHDKNWLGEAIGNLLDNSIKYSRPGSQIQVSLLQNEMFAQIKVRDFGMGIEEGEEHEIFRRFYRGRRVTNQKGFGLGMYLAREIVSGHEGFIKVEREEPGLCCSIFLPSVKKRAIVTRL